MPRLELVDPLLESLDAQRIILSVDRRPMTRLRSRAALLLTQVSAPIRLSAVESDGLFLPPQSPVRICAWE
jgi:hypothetical protein